MHLIGLQQPHLSSNDHFKYLGPILTTGCSNFGQTCCNLDREEGLPCSNPGFAFACFHVFGICAEQRPAGGAELFIRSTSINAPEVTNRASAEPQRGGSLWNQLQVWLMVRSAFASDHIGTSCVAHGPKHVNASVASGFSMPTPESDIAQIKKSRGHSGHLPTRSERACKYWSVCYWP